MPVNGVWERCKKRRFPMLKNLYARGKINAVMHMNALICDRLFTLSSQRSTVNLLHRYTKVVWRRNSWTFVCRAVHSCLRLSVLHTMYENHAWNRYCIRLCCYEECVSVTRSCLTNIVCISCGVTFPLRSPDNDAMSHWVMPCYQSDEQSCISCFIKICTEQRSIYFV